MFIPLKIRLLHNFGRSSFNIGFLLSIIGLALVIFFSIELNWKIILAEKHEFEPALAYITDTVETQYTLDDAHLYEYHYNYSFEEKTLYSGSFLELSGAYSPGEEIQIEYLKNAPEISRISGLDRRNLDKIMFFAGIAGLLAGFLFLYPSCRKTRRERKIIIGGLPAKGKLIHSEPTNLKLNNQTVYKLTYEYPCGKKKMQKFSIRSHMIRNFSEEHSENLIYDPKKPSRVIIIDTLPGPVAKYIRNILYPDYI